MPPFSPTFAVEAVVPPAVGLLTAFGTVAHAGGHDAYGALPTSIQLLWLVKPDQPSAQTQGGSMRPVEAVEELGIDMPFAKSALASDVNPPSCNKPRRAT